MQWPEPANTEQSLAPRHTARPTKGGAVRTRIALTTAVAVGIAIPTVLLALSGSTPAASPGITRHEAVTLHQGGSRDRVVRLDDTPMSYAQAERVAQMVTYADTVEARKEATFMEDLAFFRDVAFFQAIAAQQRAAQAAAAAVAAQRAAAAQAAAATAAGQVPVTSPAAGSPNPAAGASDATSTDTPDWACIRQRESGDDYGAGGGGAYQFEDGTWRSVTGLPGPAEDYPPATQDAAALELYSQRGWGPWTTRGVCGL